MLAATVVVAAVVAGAIIVALGDTSETPAPGAAPSLVAAVAPTMTPAHATRLSGTATPRVTPAGTPRPTVTPLATPMRPLRLSTAPALRAADKTVTLQTPASPFSDHDGKSIVLFDTETNTQKSFGPGNLSGAVFGQNDWHSLEQTRFAYVDASGEAWLVNLPAFRQRSMGKYPSATFIDPLHVLLGSGPTAALYDVSTDVATPVSSFPDRAMLQAGTAEPPLRLAGNVVRGGGTINAADDPCARLSGNLQRLCWDGRPEDVVLVDPFDSKIVVYSFRALRVAEAGPGELLIATPPVCTDGASTRSVNCLDLLAKLGSRELRYDDPEFATGTTNLYILDLAQGTVKFIATARYNLQTQIYNENWPLAADANYVVWTDNYCGPQRGKTRIYDRKAGTITELPGSYWFSLRNGKLGLGEFGARMLIDPGTQQFLAVLPSVAGDVRWSNDYRYAAVTAPAGHGGLCR